MNNDDATGLPVISAPDGERIGTVRRIFIDPGERRVVGFAIDAGSKFFEPEWSPKLDAANVHALGPDALVLTGSDALRADETEERYAELLEVGALLNRRVLTVDGREVGSISSVSFDEQSFALTTIEVGHGHLRRRTESLPIADLLVIGPDYAIIARSPAGAEEAEPDPVALDAPTAATEVTSAT